MDKKEMKQLAMAIFEWRKAYKSMETDPAVLKARKSLENAQKRLEKAERTYQGSLKGNKMVIENILPNIGKSITAFGIRAKFTSGYLRATYDSKTLDRIASENTRFRNLIMPHRKETEVKPRVNIEVAAPESLLQDVEFTLKGLEI